MLTGRVINLVDMVVALSRKPVARTPLISDMIDHNIILDIIDRSKHDPFFWICHVMVVAMLVYIVYNFWNRKY